jgi:hypothetical protein
MCKSDLTKDLYGKLWDNINNRDSRVWTFLSFYGAALALFLSGSGSNDIRIIDTPLIILIGFWALHLVLTAEWWSARNRLMISQIEQSGVKIDSFIPAYYMKPKFTVEGIHSFSIFTLTVVNSSLLVFSVFTAMDKQLCRASTNMFLKCSDENAIELFVIASLLGAYNILMLHVIARREKNIDEFWQMVHHFDYEKKKTDPSISRKDLAQEWSRDRSIKTFRIKAMYLSIIVTIVVGLAAGADLREVVYLIIPTILFISSFIMYKIWQPDLSNPKHAPSGITSSWSDKYHSWHDCLWAIGVALQTLWFPYVMIF